MFEINFDKEIVEIQAEKLKSISHPIRLAIVKGLIQEGHCNVNGIKDKLELPQSTVSQHLQVLRNAGIVKGEKAGTVVNYKIIDGKMEDLIKVLDS